MNLNSKGIEIIMAEKKLSLKAVSERGGITSQGIYNALRAGRATPQTVGKIAAGLGVQVADILETA